MRKVLDFVMDAMLFSLAVLVIVACFTGIAGLVYIALMTIGGAK